jgi:membrane protein implicated in regulation of membrane protease activity
MATPRMMLVLLGATALVVGVIAALALGSWWILIGVMLVHLLASAGVIAYAWLRASESHDKPDPVTEARVEEERGDRADEEEPRPRRTAGDREVFS